MSEQNVNQPTTEQPVIPAPGNPAATQENDPYSDAFERQVAGLAAHIQAKAGKATTEPAKPEAKVEVQPAAQEQPAPTAEPAKPLTATKPEIPQYLVARARELGWSDGKIESYGDALQLERTLNDIDATMATVMRRQQTQTGPEQPQKVEQPAPKQKLNLWDGLKRDDFDEPVAKQLDKLAEYVEKVSDPLLKEIDQLKQQLRAHDDYLNDHARQSRAAVIDQIGDKLAAAGYEDVFGKGRSKPGTAAYENKGLLAQYLQASMANFAQIGMQCDLDEVAEFFARQRWGNRSQQQPAQQQQFNIDPANAPRGQRPNPREQQPTATNRPTARQGETPKGRDSAIAALTNGRMLNGWSGDLNLGDIHDS